MTSWETIFAAGAGRETLEIKRKVDEDGTWYRRVIRGLEEGSGQWSSPEKNILPGALLEDTSWLAMHPIEVDSELYPDIQKRLLAANPGRTQLWSSWAHVVFGEEADTALAAAFILHAGTVCVLTGAGISTESNLPDFRSSTGWWRKIDPKTVASIEALTNEYELFQSFYAARIQALEQAEPNNGHAILASWEKENLLHLTATQNVDGLHQRAGSQKTAELHGSLASFSCSVCHESAEKDAFLGGEGCRLCGGKLRPDVVLFGEPLPGKAWKKTFDAVEKADVLLIVGTSLEVAPANQIPRQTQGRTIYINKDRAGTWEDFDLILTGSSGAVLKQIDFWIQTVKPK